MVQTVLWYGINSCVIMDAMMKLFKGFHYQISKMILWKTARYVKEEVWEWPPAEEALEAAGLWPIQEYLLRRHPTIEY